MWALGSLCHSIFSIFILATSSHRRDGKMDGHKYYVGIEDSDGRLRSLRSVCKLSPELRRPTMLQF